MRTKLLSSLRTCLMLAVVVATGYVLPACACDEDVPASECDPIGIL